MTLQIKVSPQTKVRLTRYGNLDSSFDSVIVELLDHADLCDKYWSERQ